MERKGSTVSRKEVQAFVGALAGKSNKGVFITTSGFTNEAIEYVEKLADKTVILIDSRKLAELMIKYNLGVVARNKYEIKEVDVDYFGEEN